MAVVVFLCISVACETRHSANDFQESGVAQDVTALKTSSAPDQPAGLTIAPIVEAAMEEKDLRPALLRTVDAYPKAFPTLIKNEINESPLIVRKELDDLIDIGNFRCDLKSKTFAYITAGGEGRGYRAQEGRFVFNDRSEWVGEITNVVSGHK
jgi:hypothetical protein